MYLQVIAQVAHDFCLHVVNCAGNSERGGAIDGSIASFMDFFPIEGPVRVIFI